PLANNETNRVHRALHETRGARITGSVLETIAAGRDRSQTGTRGGATRPRGAAREQSELASTFFRLILCVTLRPLRSPRLKDFASRDCWVADSLPNASSGAIGMYSGNRMGPREITASTRARHTSHVN